MDIMKCIESMKSGMQNALSHFETDLMRIRAGKANPHILDNVMVDYYGNSTALSQVASVGTADARTIVIQPWEKAMLVPIEKAILKANLGLTPTNNGDMIRISVPPLTEERRKSLVKEVKSEGENTKVVIRNQRRDALEELKKLKKNGVAEDAIKDAEGKIQKITDDFIAKIDKAVEAKEKEILTV